MAKKKSKSKKRRTTRSKKSRNKRPTESMTYEPLEPKQLLATISVNTTFDVVDANDGQTSLREAIAQANATPADDRIEIDVPVQAFNPVQMFNSNGEFLINGTVATAGNLTIDGNGNTIQFRKAFQDHSAARIFHVNKDGNANDDGNSRVRGNTNLTLIDLHLKGGQQAEDNDLGQDDESNSLDFHNSKHSGGAIRFQSGGTLTLTNSSVKDSFTRGFGARGGGIFAAGEVVLNNSVVEDNKTGIYVTRFFLINRAEGTRASGGGIFSETGVTLNNNSFVRNNKTQGNSAPGGGIATSGFVELNDSTVSGNYTDGDGAYGGGIYAGGIENNILFGLPGFAGSRFVMGEGRVELNNSHVTGNYTDNIDSEGGGIHAISVSLTNESSVANNSTRADGGRGGGIYALTTLEIDDSKLMNNHTRGGTSPAAALSCQIGVWALKEVVGQIPVIGDVYDAFGYANDLLNLLDPPLGIDTDPCPAAGGYSHGGGAFAGQVTITNDSEVSGNFTTGFSARGGAILGRASVLVEDSTVSGNHTNGNSTGGGAIATNFPSGITSLLGYQTSPVGRVTIVNSLFDGNYTLSTARGGAINAASVDITSSTFNGNHTKSNGLFDGGANGGAILAKFGTINSSLFTGNFVEGRNSGGGAVNVDVVNIYDSVFINNRTTGSSNGDGGAVLGASVVVAGSTFQGNFTESEGSDGGAISAGQELGIYRSTFTDNEVRDSDANGGAVFFRGPSERAFISQSTFTRNSSGETNGGGAIYGTRLELSNNIVVGNTAAGSSNDVGSSINTVFTGNNAIEVVSGSANAGNRFVATPVQVFDNVGGVEGILTDNFGKPAGKDGATIVRTIALDKTSNPAIDATTIDSRESDQRGFFKQFNDPNNSNGGLSDLGAVEQQDVNPFYVTTTSLSGVGSLPYAVDLARNNNNGLDKITFSPALAGATIQLGQIGGVTENTFFLDESLDIDASNLSQPVIIRGTGNHRLFDTISSSFVGNLTLNNLDLSNGRADNPAPGAGGGAILFEGVGELKLINTSVHDNTSTADGGAIRADDANVTLIDSRVFDNATETSSDDGGGISAENVFLYGSHVYGNSTAGYGADGGGIFATDSVKLTNSTVTGNSTDGEQAEGGGIHASNSVTLINSSVSDNETNDDDSQGGGIFTATLTAESSLISGNSTNSSFDSDGGGIFTTGLATIVNSTVANNSISGQARGGGIYAENLILSNGTVTGNKATSANSNDGGIFVEINATVSDSLIIGNFSANVSPTHEISFSKLTQFGNNLISPSYIGDQQAQANEVFEQTTSNGGRFAGVLSSNGGLHSVALKETAANPALDGTIAPESLFSFEGNADDGFGNNNGTFNGGLTATANGLRGNAVEFTGNSSQFIELSSPLTFGNQSNTVEAWINIPENAPGAFMTILGSNGANWGVNNGGGVHFFGFGIQLDGATDLRDGAWHHVSFVRDKSAGTLAIFIDGEQEVLNTSAGSDVNFTSQPRIGLHANGSDPWVGTIDEVTIHERALSLGEIKARAGQFDGRGEGFDRIKGNAPQLDIGAFEAKALEQKSLTVTTLDDTVDPFDGETSLREAIEFANDGDADGVDGDKDTITFDPSLAGGTVDLENGALVIIESLDIIGVENTIDANFQSRVINFNVSTGDLQLDDLELTNGVSTGSGGGVRFNSSGDLTLNRTRVSSNTADTVGGGIFAQGNLTLNNSLIDSNDSDGDGGGARVFGSMIVNNSTITNNVSQGYGGGLNVNGNFAMKNSTVVGNESLEAAAQSGGLFLLGSASIENSIVLGNRVPVQTLTEIYSYSAINFGGTNIVGESIANFDTTGLTNVQNALSENVFTTGRIQLATGDFIPAISLRPVLSNPALDAGDNSLAPAGSTDGRGEDRIVDIAGIPNTANQTIDLGAYELQSDVKEERSLVVTISDDIVDEFDFQTSLREAIAFADDPFAGFDSEGDADGDGRLIDTVSFASGPGEHFSVPRTITLATNGLGDDIDVTSGLTIQGPGADQLTIDANSGSKIFEFATDLFVGNTSQISAGDLAFFDQEFSIKDITLTGGVSNNTLGGAIQIGNVQSLAPQNLILENVIITGNEAEQGGAIFAANSNVRILNSALTNNFASSFGYSGGGSAIHLLNSNATITNSTISGNQDIEGVGVAAIYQRTTDSSSSLKLHNVTLANNQGYGVEVLSYAAAGTTHATNVEIGNSILATNAGGNIGASTSGSGSNPITITSLGGNIADVASTGITATNDQIADPLLNPLDPATATHSLQQGSPAIDAGVDKLVGVLANPIGVATNTDNDFRPVENLTSFDNLNVLNFDLTPELDVNNSWVTDGVGSDYFEDGGEQPELLFDLGVEKSISQIAIWGYREFAGNDAKEMLIEFSTDGGLHYDESVSITKPQFTTTDFVHTLSLGGARQANQIRITISDNYGGDRVGLQEVRFLETPTSTDQRGEVRIIDGNNDGTATVDSGAFEFVPTAQTFVVDVFHNFDDGNVTQGNLSLAEAVRLANDNVGFTDTITFDPNVFSDNDALGTLSEYTLTESVTISGFTDRRLWISGASNLNGSDPLKRIFNLGGAGENTYTIENIGLINADGGNSTGGAIRLVDVDDTLIVDNVQFTGNRSNGGGAIFVNGSDYLIKNSSFVSNSANANGSAILAIGATDGLIVNSTFSNNSTTTDSAAIFLQATGASVAKLKVINSTIDSNSRGIQAHAASGSSATLEIGNSIVSESFAGENARTSGAGTSSIVSLGNNISDDGSSAFSASSDLINTDPKLGQLSSSLGGGGTTQTRSLLADSPAIDGGSNAIALDEDDNQLITDQRGETRFVDGNASSTATVDIGAFEAQEVRMVGSNIFYKDSSFDGANASDASLAIASDKSVLREGETATFENYTGYVHGVNGLIIDLPNTVNLIDADFELKFGNEDNTNNWTTFDSNTAIISREVIVDGGVNGSDRVILEFADGTFTNGWLQVKVVANQFTGLTNDEVFYFGNWVGEVTGPESNGIAIVNSTDMSAVQADFTPIFPPTNELITEALDVNKDKKINSTDASIVGTNFTPFFPPGQGLKMITPSTPPAPPSFGSISGGNGSDDASSIGDDSQRGSLADRSNVVDDGGDLSDSSADQSSLVVPVSIESPTIEPVRSEPVKTVTVKTEAVKTETCEREFPSNNSGATTSAETNGDVAVQLQDFGRESQNVERVSNGNNQRVNTRIESVKPLGKLTLQSTATQSRVAREFASEVKTGPAHQSQETKSVQRFDAEQANGALTKADMLDDIFGAELDLEDELLSINF